MALKWSTVWPGREFSAKTGNLTYRVVFNGSRWTVRGWVGEDPSLYDDGPFLEIVQDIAADHAAKYSD